MLTEDLGLDLEVPGVVDLAGLQHRAGGRDGVTATLKDHPGEGGLIGLTVVLVGFEDDHVVGAEVGDCEGAGADGAEVLFSTGLSCRPQAGIELRLLDNRVGGTDEGAVGEGLGHAEGDDHGQLIDSFDADYIGEVR